MDGTQRQPAAATQHFRRGEALRDLGRWEDAAVSYSRAVAEAPRYVEAHCNRGNALQQLERWDEALICYDEAIDISPDLAMLHSNRGVVLKELGRFEESLTSFDRAIALRPGYATAYFNRAIVLLSQGDLARGFADYEWRWEDKSGSVYKEKRAFAQPRWHGEPLSGKTVLFYSEQGYGDTLQFCRYVPLLAGMGARVILEVRTPLVNLLADLPGVSQLVPLGSPLPAFDFQIPSMSAPLAFKTTLETIPLAERYLMSDPAKVAEWQERLGEKRRPLIGLAWSGNAAHAKDRRRNVGLEQLLAGLPDGIEYVSLQKDMRERDLEVMRAHPELLNVSDGLQDFSDTAALCECMDLVISVDTSVAHLAGALGRPAWILLPFQPDWRWLLERSNSPWYSSVRLYRQAAPDDWRQPLERMAADLRLMGLDSGVSMRDEGEKSCRS
jgi:hypothetical protein